MISLNATSRNNKTKGELSTIRKSGNVPAIVYGGKEENQKISISKKLLKSTIEKENFLSNIITLSVNGKNQGVTIDVKDFGEMAAADVIKFRN